MRQLKLTVFLNLLLWPLCTAFAEMDYFHMAEGWSSATVDAGVKVGWRAFTIYTAREACKQSAIPARFQLDKPIYQVKVGDRWHPQSIVVRALDASDRFIGKIPISLLTEHKTEVFHTSSAELPTLTFTDIGRIKLVIRTLCTAPDRHIEQELALEIIH